MKTFVIVFVLAIVVAAAGFFIYLDISKNKTTGGQPSQSVSLDEGNWQQKQDLITINSPRPNDVVSSPLAITGEAVGNWYFEASFPVKIFDSTGNVLGVVPAQAQGNWMTTDFVPYTATLEFSTSTTATGTLVLAKDNPSGLPQNDDSLIVPIKF